MPNRLHVGIVTPAKPSSNNGNWQTAWRWSRLLAQRYQPRVLQSWRDEPADLLIALHARRSAASIQAWHHAQRGPLVLVLTGTDLYRDIDRDASAQASLQLADRLVVLQELGPQRLPETLRARCTVCFQSCSAWRAVAKTTRHLRAVMVGHLRDEKSPETYFEAARLLAARDDIVLDHIGAPLDAALGEQARALARQQPRYRWLDALDHATTRRRIQHAHLLVHASRMEGGAHVIAEAVRSGTPVIASRIDGNVGMLGADYAGYFEWHDAAGLAALLRRARDEPAWLRTLVRQCRQRARLFEPKRERATLLAMLDRLLPRR
ncbi:MAG TPA: selenoneine biosynthesis selenosugar synthase SenB [Burkholderiaceae bacterium]|nr:selenoneine biosynthesis selenosugar synthase SenB [Burkholderiaceae bacterium]